MRIQFEKPKPYGSENFLPPFVSSGEPFVLNPRAVLIHRPRTFTLHKTFLGSHHATLLWCGSNFASRDLTLISEPPNGRLVCSVCEARAVMAGQPTSTELAGRHVCVGKVRAINTCTIHGEG